MRTWSFVEHTSLTARFFGFKNAVNSNCRTEGHVIAVITITDIPS